MRTLCIMLVIQCMASYRSVLLIPALCGNLCEQNIIHAFAHASQNDLIAWEKKHIPYTIRGERRTFFDSQKMGNTSATG